MDKSSPRPQSPGAEIYRDRLRKSCQHNFVIVTNFFITLRDQIYRQGFGKKLSGETKGRMAGLLSRVETESCKCCKCCKFRPDLNLSAKIWSLYRKPTTALSSWSFHQSFSIHCRIQFHKAILTSICQILDSLSNVFYIYILSLQRAIYCLKMCPFDFAIIKCMIDLIVRFHGT